MISNLRDAEWFKSSKSADASECVEIAFSADASIVGMRDSKDPGGPVLAFSGEQWDRFLGSDLLR